MSTMALEVAPFCTRVLAPFYLRVSIDHHKLLFYKRDPYIEELSRDSRHDVRFYGIRFMRCI